MLTVPPSLTAACYVAVLCLMVWKRCKAAWIWLIVGSSLFGIAYAFFLHWQYEHWRIGWYAHDSRLYLLHLSEWACELFVFGLLFSRTQWLRAASDWCCLCAFFIVTHLMLRWGYALSFHPGLHDDPLLTFLGDCANLLLCASIGVVVWTRRYCAEDV